MEPNSEVKQKPSPLEAKLEKAATPLQAIINEPLIIDPKDPLNIHAGVNSGGRFSFWAGLEPLGFHAELPSEPTAVIKNLRVPETLRGQGLGSRIVKVWEDELSKEGINIFAATNIKDSAAIEFWKKLGYQIPKSEFQKNIPYYMYKVVKSTS